MIVLNYTRSNVFTFADSNAGTFLFWQSIPTILAVLPCLLRKIIYLEVAQLQPYRNIAGSKGSTLTESDLLDDVLLLRSLLRTKASE
jgi:hypothetical protein